MHYLPIELSVDEKWTEATLTLKRTAKELIRHVLYRMGHRRKYAHLSGDRSANFNTIYRTGVWQHGDGDIPGSGTGSTIDATASLRSELANAICEYGIASLLDIGCGDFTWMQHTGIECDYIGVDIVPGVIVANTKSYANDKRKFLVADFVENNQGLKADAVLCREVLFHLSLADARSVIRNALGTGCRYLLLTSDKGTKFNSNIVSGDFRLLNLQRRPFTLPKPLQAIRDENGGEAPGRIVGIWDAEDVRKQF
ncbi:MAG: class I SAM-dependent methyltransferase [Novosphingobium sp.]